RVHQQQRHLWLVPRMPEADPPPPARTLVNHTRARCPRGGFTVPHHRSAALRVDELERRDAPATLVSPTKVTYQDADGDIVAIKFSNAILSAGNVNSVITFINGNVDGTNAAKQQLELINLTSLGAAANGTSIAVEVTLISVNGGDGFVAVGGIYAEGIDPGSGTPDGGLCPLRSGGGAPPPPAPQGGQTHCR